MPITEITIENFKGISDRVTIPIRPITLLFGANSAGKSTVFEALLYLKELLEHKSADADYLQSSGDAIDLGGFKQLVHQHDTERTVKIGVTMTVDDDGLPTQPISIPWADTADYTSSIAENGLIEIHTVSVEVSIYWDRDSNRGYIQTYKTALNGEPLGTISADNNFGPQLISFNYNHPVFTAQFSPDVIISGELNSISQALEQTFSELDPQNDLFPELGILNLPLEGQVIPQWSKIIHFANASDEVNLFNLRFSEFIISNLMVGSGEVIVSELQKSRYLGPLRIVPERQFNARRTQTDARWSDGSAAWDLLFQDVDRGKSLIKNVSNTLSDKLQLNMGYSMDANKFLQLPTDGIAISTLQQFAIDSGDMVIEEYAQEALKELYHLPAETRLTITDQAKHTTVDACDIGSGVSQVIPVIVAAMQRDSKITAIEQPELHIHPAVQCGLGDVFVREIRRDPDRLFLIETHSEHFLLRLMKRMRETQQGEAPSDEHTLTPEDITVLFVETYAGRSVYREMPLNERGELIKAWPGGFFEEDMNELF